jgi:cytidylate kinase
VKKSEIRNPKHETNSNVRNIKTNVIVYIIWILDLEFVSDFDIRYSNLLYLRLSGDVRCNGADIRLFVSQEPRKLVITIDGPAGAGKSTVSKLLAKQLGYIYVDTGAMYRAVAVLARDSEQANPQDESTLEDICRGLDLQFVNKEGTLHLLANGRDVTTEIRRPEISSLASAVSAQPVVRERLSEIQQRMGAAGGVVLEGRDMGTVVFPEADVKFFLDANPEIRSKRRYLELEVKGEKTTPQEVYQQMVERDRNDSSRELAPLRPAADAIVVDSSNLQVEEVVQLMLGHIEKQRIA